MGRVFRHTIAERVKAALDALDTHLSRLGRFGSTAAVTGLAVMAAVPLHVMVRRLEGLRAGVPVTTVVVVDGPQEIQKVATAADWTPVWAFREGQQQDDAALLKSCLESWKPGTGDGYVWIAGEARTARQLRDYMLDTRQHPKVWLKATGYWVRGVAGESDKLD